MSPPPSPEYFTSFFIPFSGCSSAEASLCFLLLAAVFAFWLTPGGLAWALSRARAQPRPAIPGPAGLPILGLILPFTNSLTHRALSALAKSSKAEPLMAFSVGLRRHVISGSPETAREILNSSAFANRPVKESAYGLLFDRAMGFAPYGEYWRNLRRIAAAHLFSPARVAGFGRFRQEIGLKMVEEIKTRMASDNVVEIKNLLHFASLNNVMTTVFGKSYDFSGGGAAADGGLELEWLVKEGYELLGMFNLGDYFPILGFLDLQGVRKRSKKLVGRVNAFVGKMIDEHRMKRSKLPVDHDHHSQDFVDVLLDLEHKENRLSDSDMIAVLWEMIFRGTDTVAILLEWILARMVIHPDIQIAAQSEIDRAIGGDNRKITDSDLANLPYLQAIVKETLRVHPPGPLLSWARLAIDDTFLGPHFIPAGTTAMVNMWSITHDSKIWPDPEIFRPERFLIADVAVMGSDLRLAPFGSGRRVCPGKTMGLATVQLWLAQLLRNFDWIESDKHRVDLSENLKLSLEMEQPLVCKAVARSF
ncbi:cytochrome P450 78A5-like [Andrographis paniculata]|uniref:cytochrome P450 78A5-like n=1 Tax=Andrographis paniculata TaxID=175694 RepID=UPI0021E9936D|nr:cytochrome P450 78A5-like [Andrographis paniculata]